MLSLSNYLSQLYALFDELLKVAENLRNLTSQVLSEKELNIYQEEQKKIISEMSHINQNIDLHYRNQIDKVDQKLLKEKAQQFHKINHEYIQNLKKNHGLIQFELTYLHDQSQGVESLVE